MAIPKIRTFEGACRTLKLDAKKVLPKVSAFPKQHQAALIAAAKLLIIVQALNGKWNPDWQDTNQPKYYPWWDMEKDANNTSGFRLLSVGYDCTDSAVGSRLCFRSREIAEYAAKQFIDIYRDYMVIE